MLSGRASNSSSHPGHHRGGSAAIRSAPSSTRFFSQLGTSCPWRYLPSSFPPWQTVYYHLRQFCRTGLWTHLWRALHEAERQRMGKDPHPSAAIMASQSVKTVEASARIRGFDAHQGVKGRKRHLLVDTLGLPISVYVTPAGMHDTQDARRLLAELKYARPTPEEDLGRCRLPGQRIGRLVQSARRLGPGGGRAHPRRPWLQRASETLDRGADLRLALAEPPHSRDDERKV